MRLIPYYLWSYFSNVFILENVDEMIDVQCSFQIVHCIVYDVQSNVYTVYTVHCLQSTIYQQLQTMVLLIALDILIKH